MLTGFFLNIFITIFNFAFSWGGTITTLPFGIDAFLQTGMGYFYSLVAIIPPLGIILSGFLWVIGFKLLLKLLAMIPVIKGVLYKSNN